MQISLVSIFVKIKDLPDRQEKELWSVEQWLTEPRAEQIAGVREKNDCAVNDLYT